MRKLIFSLTGLLVVACASTPKKTASVPIPRGNQIMTVVQKGMSMTFFVRAAVNGQPRRFRLDTGARNSVVIADEQTKSLPSDRKFLFGGAANQPISCDLIYLDKYEIAGWTWSHTPIFRCAANADNENYLGIDYFDRQIVSLDFVDARISLLKSAPADAKMLPLVRGSQGHIELPVKIDGTETLAVFDTGAAITIVDEKFVEAHPNAFETITVTVDGQEKDVQSNMADWTGHPLQGKLYLAKGMEVGSLKIEKQMVVTAPISGFFGKVVQTPIVIGANAMVGAKWIFDLKNNLWLATQKVNPQTALGFVIGADQIIHRSKDHFTLKGNAQLTMSGWKINAEKILINAQTKKVRAVGAVIFDDNGKVSKDEKMSFRVVDGQMIRE